MSKRTVPQKTESTFKVDFWPNPRDEIIRHICIYIYIAKKEMYSRYAYLGLSSTPEGRDPFSEMILKTYT